MKNRSIQHLASNGVLTPIECIAIKRLCNTDHLMVEMTFKEYKMFKNRTLASRKIKRALKKAKYNGVILGRPRVLVNVERLKVLRKYHTFREISEITEWSIGTIQRRLRNE
jgi:roadblock/LC7 domain-containing protein